MKSMVKGVILMWTVVFVIVVLLSPVAWFVLHDHWFWLIAYTFTLSGGFCGIVNDL